MQIDSSSKQFNSSLKKLNKHMREYEKLEKIINHIKLQDSYADLKCNPISQIYDFEELKENLSGYCSFNLCKKGGTIRLIFSLETEYNNSEENSTRSETIKLNIISFDHYKDLKNKEF